MGVLTLNVLCLFCAQVETSDPAELTAAELAAELNRSTFDPSTNTTTSAESAKTTTTIATTADDRSTLLGNQQAFGRPKRPGRK